MDEWMKRCRGEIDRLIDWIGLLFHEVGLTADQGVQKKACDRQARGIGMCQIDSDRDLMPRGVRGREKRGWETEVNRWLIRRQLGGAAHPDPRFVAMLLQRFDFLFVVLEHLYTNSIYAPLSSSLKQ
ncbi:hypothetical protein ASPNIDRAFT_42527 [Aspergillus niger ATCC 1015]|uniref:Uncharacterized protein n=1 Tax=Aspergillus niger (strain ATCC 1015 / CBS 113.46 / FGSC A1144 / LSHB Ac4 / NCTC 3858a / NRRL 328 / USDA 3528.7) TaxID=380704 RepID=G3XV66_ASPNA|nr:hypothetical protein ASPNIDRAFT_42527 [Aspergillus niger ATCC 1015]